MVLEEATGRCTECSFVNPEGVRFCGGCGHPLPTQCARCGRWNPPEFKFCGHCSEALDGEPVSGPLSSARSGPRHVASLDHAERRQLTVLFCDLVGSVQLSESVDPEEWREIVRGYHSIVSEVTERHEGRVAQYLGDGVLVYFGHPLAHEDDPARAVRAGLEVVEAIRRANVEQRRTTPIQVRVGIHTGLGIAGDVGAASRPEQLVIGSAPNIAARLHAAAGPEQVVISEDTRRLVDGLFQLEPLERFELKGVARPIQAYRALKPSGLRARFDVQQSRGLGALAGRDAEMDMLLARLAETRAGRGQTVVINGEAGLGKSRLIHALATAASRDVMVLTARCSPYSQNSALLPLVETYEDLFGLRRDGEDTKRLEQGLARDGETEPDALPLLESFLSLAPAEAATLSELSPQKQRERTLRLLHRLLIGQTERGPLLLAIEDLHWVDPTTLEFVDSLMNAGANARLLLVLTTRPSFKPPWGFRPYLTQVDLGRLASSAVNEIIDRICAGRSLSREVRGQLLHRTDGVPLYVEEMTKAVLESGATLEADNAAGLVLPATLRDSLTARLDRLGPAKDVAQVASVIGRRFSFDLLAHVSPLEGRFLRRHLDQLSAAELIFREEVAGEETYAFKHVLIQEAAYESLLRKTRQALHQSIAETLRQHFPETEESRPELLAEHFEGANLATQAVESWIRAGRRASERSANFECIAHMRRALSLLETLPPDFPGRTRSEMAAQLALGPALMATQGWAAPEVEAACSRAHELCLREGNNEGLLGALWGLWTVRFVRGEHLPALEAAEAILVMALPTGSPVLSTVAHHGVGFTRYFLGDFASAREHGEHGVAPFDIEIERGLVRTFQLSSTIACMTFLAQSLWFLGFPEQAELRQAQAFAISDALANPVCTAYALGVGLYLPFAKRDLSTTRALAERCRALADQEGFAVWSSQARFYLGWVRALSGEPEAGLAEMKEGWEAFRRTGSNVQATQWWLMQAEALRVARRGEEALAALAEGIRHAELFAEHAFEPELHRLQGEILAERGLPQEGEVCLRRSLELARKQRAKMLELRSAVALGRLFAERGQSSEARATLEQLCASFSEGDETEDLRQARRLVEEWASNEG